MTHQQCQFSLVAFPFSRRELQNSLNPLSAVPEHILACSRAHILPCFSVLVMRFSIDSLLLTAKLVLTNLVLTYSAIYGQDVGTDFVLVAPVNDMWTLFAEGTSLICGISLCDPRFEIANECC